MTTCFEGNITTQPVFLGGRRFVSLIAAEIVHDFDALRGSSAFRQALLRAHLLCEMILYAAYRLVAEASSGGL